MAEWYDVHIELLKAGAEKHKNRFGRVLFSQILQDEEFWILRDRFGLTAVQIKWAELTAVEDPATEATETTEPIVENSHNTNPTVVPESLPRSLGEDEDANTFAEERGLSVETKTDRLPQIESLQAAATPDEPPPSYIDEFFLTHTVDGIFPEESDRLLYAGRTETTSMVMGLQEHAPPLSDSFAHHQQVESDDASPGTIVPVSPLGSLGSDGPAITTKKSEPSTSELLFNVTKETNLLLEKKREKLLQILYHSEESNLAALDEQRKLEMRRIIESMSSKTGIYSKKIKGLSDELSDDMSYLSKLDKEVLLNVFPDIGCVDDDSSDHLFAAPPGKRSYDKPICPETLDAEFLSLVENPLEGIYVRFYNSGMGLLRAVIVGDEGTPYSDGLFFFDIKLPLGYGGHSSILEPAVRYHWHLSGGESINPNIHKLGEVVLSYTKRDKVGNMKKEHIWDPLKLSVGHLLSAIKSKLLNDDPLHSLIRNDISTIEKQKSLLYNETVIIRSLDTMIRTMRSPPQHFEVFVVSHFKRRAAAILSRCKSYVQVCDNSKLEPKGTMSFICDVIERMERLQASFSSIGVMDEQMTEKVVDYGSLFTYMKQESVTPTVLQRLSDPEMWSQQAPTTPSVPNRPCYIKDLHDPWLLVGLDFWAKLLHLDLPDVPWSGWLEERHFRAWTNCLRRSRKSDDDWTVMGPDFFNAFEYDQYITQQADGTMAGWPPWWSVKRVFFPVNWNNSHWILGLLDLQTWKLFIFDSSSEVYGPRFDVNVVYGALFQHFQGKIGLFLQLIKYFENLDQKFVKVDLKMVPVKVPQQCNERDCGIFTCMNMYQLTKVTKPPLAGPEEFRLLMKAELSKHSNAMIFRGFMAGQLSEKVFYEIPESV